ncbi:hypothetical protein EV359DRAFT_67998 [Lentinula novae-zelandiae]|nr:hypothetical protein EV359DRAFT_67998 [Lentinula novae-zelandiae]
MADLSLSVTQLQALHTLLLLQGSNFPEDLKSLPASLQAQLALNSSASSFPTPSPSPEKLPRTGSISLARARLRPPWLFSQPRATCEVGTQVEDPALTLKSFSGPSSPASSAGYGAGSEVEVEDSAHEFPHESADHPCNSTYDATRRFGPRKSTHESTHKFRAHESTYNLEDPGIKDKGNDSPGFQKVEDIPVLVLASPPLAPQLLLQSKMVAKDKVDEDDDEDEEDSWDNWM